MHWIILLLLLMSLVLGPQLWVRWVLLRHHQQAEEDFPGTGGELARHLLDRFQLKDVGVEVSEMGDHYDPASKTVRLTKDKLEGRTLTAVTVAAHEVGHALQDAADEPSFRRRTRLANWTMHAQTIGSLLLFTAPILGLVTRSPAPAIISAVAAFLIMGSGLVVQFLTVPVELDASFRKALPLLRSGYIKEEQIPAVRQILRAAAWTYVAGSLASLLNIWRWLVLLRR